MINQGEERFRIMMEAKGFTLISQPMIEKAHIRPDFFCREEEIYYEVFSTRQAYHLRKFKIERAQRMGLRIKVVDPDGNPYPKPKLKKEVQISPPKAEFIFPDPTSSEMILYAQTFGLKIERFRPHYRCLKRESEWNGNIKTITHLPVECPNCKSPNWRKHGPSHAS